MKYIINGKIVLPDRIVEGKALAYDTKIEGIVDVSEIPASAEVYDACGNYVAPGLVDIHIHGYVNADVSDGSSDGIRAIAEGIAKNGVTSFLPTTMTVSLPEIDAALDSVRAVKEESKSWNGAEIIGVHAEGPFINPSKKGAQAEENILKPDAEYLIKNQDIIRSVTLAPEMDTDHECIKRVAKETNIVISMGHTDAKFEEAMSAVADGVSHSTHLYNAMSPMHHRKPGVVSAIFSSNVSTELIADTFHIHPGLFGMVAAIKKDKLVLITDCTRAGGMPDGEYSLGGQPIFLKGIQCLLADGTIAGSVLKLNNAVKNVLDATDLDVPTVVSMATINAAKAIREDHRIGSLENGKDADIIIADGNFNIIRTVKGGRVIYNA
ncbi:MAG: N-acetylglucosamine-6-phosphate deacetylase [Clostridia bacterium]|nr:N-acetylglucosamine-6-phosphate deacetylase [Clostridia bacterium]